VPPVCSENAATAGMKSDWSIVLFLRLSSRLSMVPDLANRPRSAS
jgi:hypothetical protein